MVTKLVITDNKNSSINYISKLENFQNGTEYAFKPGVNIIVGENGCGKTTLMNLLRDYLLVDYTECYKGDYNSRINRLCRTLNGDKMLDGVEVYADYAKNTFRLSHSDEKAKYDAIKTFDEFGAFANQSMSSTGEGVLISLDYLFNHIFGKNVKLMFDYNQFKDDYPSYVDYVEKHRVVCDDEWTILMDEPDRNLSITNLETIKEILSFHKENTQVITVIHNPLLIYALSSIEHINFIEMTKDYIENVKKQVNNLIR